MEIKPSAKMARGTLNAGACPEYGGVLISETSDKHGSMVVYIHIHAVEHYEATFQYSSSLRKVNQRLVLFIPVLQ